MTSSAAIGSAGPSGVVHTHSTDACAWAARCEPVPCVLTMQADDFGGEIPIGPFALIGDDSIGRGIVETLRGSRSPAVLMAKHGPFTIVRTAKDAVAAVMCEDVRRSVHISRQQHQAADTSRLRVTAHPTASPTSSPPSVAVQVPAARGRTAVGGP